MNRLTLDLTAARGGEPSLTDGLSLLAEQVREHNRAAPRLAVRATDGLASLFEAELRLGLEAADADRAYEAAASLWRRTGDGALTHSAISRVLHGVGEAWAAGSCTVVREHRISAAAQVVLTRLRQLVPPPQPQPEVVLAVPPGDRHVLALESLDQLLRHAGYATDVVGELPAHELAEVATTAAAVVLSVHTTTRAVPALLDAVRAAAPQALLVVGGPAAPRSARADLVTQDPAALVAALASSGALTTREREVLRCVADGLSNQETAQVLDVTPGTVKTHLDRIFTKTGAGGRAAAVATAMRRGWIH